MPFGFGSGPGRAARRLRSSTPASIFGPNLRAWFDNQDLSTMWQDVAMTTPAAIGQGVAMQRCKVNPATFYRSQSTASRRPILRQTAGGVYYLECDGVDDGLVTPPLNLTNTDKMAIFAGLRKLSDAARSTYCEFSSSYGNPGTFAVESPGPGLTGIMMAHNGSTSPITSTGTAVAPMTAVISGLASISPASVKIRINTASSTPNTNSVGTGNYSNNALYFFRRGGTNQPFNGWDFGSFIVDRTPTTDEITAAEAWLNHFVGAY